MRIPINVVNLGLHYEACIICSQNEYEKPAFSQSCAEHLANTHKFLTESHAVRTFFFVYDRDEMTKQVERVLSTCPYNLFMLWGEEANAAMKQEDHPLRKVYAYVQKHNPNSMALCDIGGEAISNNRDDIPAEMNSLNWLHRRNFLLRERKNSPKNMAQALCEEIRWTFSHRKELQFAKMIDGATLKNAYAHYDKLFTWLIFGCLLPLLTLLGVWVSTFSDEVLGGDFFLIIGGILRYGAAAGMFILPSALLGYHIVRLDRMANVSPVFFQFRTRMVKVGAILLATALTLVGAAYYFYLGPELFAAPWMQAYLIYVPVHLVLIGSLISTILLKTIAHRSGNLWITFARQYKIYSLTVRPAIWAGVAAAILTFIRVGIPFFSALALQ